MVKIEIIREVNHLKSIKEEWDYLFQSNLCNTIFQSFNFYYYSYVNFHSNDKLFVIILRDEISDKILSILPLCIIRRTLQFINNVHADYSDILVDKSYKNINIFLSLEINLFEHIFLSDEFDSIRFHNLKESSNLLKILHKIHHQIDNNSRWFSLNLVNKFHSNLSLTKTNNFPDNFDHLVNRQKRRLRRILKKYNTDITIHTSSRFNNDIVLDSHNNIYFSRDFPRKELLNLRGHMIRESLRSKYFLCDKFVILIENLFNSGDLFISSLKWVDTDETVALSIMHKSFLEPLESHDSKSYEASNVEIKNLSYSFWIDLYKNQQMINIYHNTSIIKLLTNKESIDFKKNDLSSKSDIINFDFGRGTYDYKMQNFIPKIVQTQNIYYFRSNFRKMLFNIFNYFNQILRLILKKR